MGDLKWSLSDPELDVLGRVGVGAIALALDAAKEMGHDLGPLHGSFDSTELRLSWPADVDDQDALTPLVEWIWQTRGAPAGQDPSEGLGVLYLPAIHRGDARDDITRRLVEHSGILSTFLQHPRIQPKTKQKTAGVRIEDRTTFLRYVEPKNEIAYVKDFSKALFRRKRLKAGPTTFSSCIRPGATARHDGEESWTGSVREAIALIAAPTACFYFYVRGKDWVVVAPDPEDLEEFVLLRPLVSLSPRTMMAASAADAAFRVMVTMKARTAAQQLERRRNGAQQCFVMRVGEVAWNKQNVRNRALRLRPTEELVDAFHCVERRFANGMRERRDDESVFITVPSPRVVIAENLAEGAYWYKNLFEVPSDLRDQVEKDRKSGESTQRVWFRWMRRHRKELAALMEDLEKQQALANDIDATFRDAFHVALRSIYGREADQAKRGSRSVVDRLEDRTEKIRRELTKAQTRQHVRGVLAELFAEAGRNRTLQANAGEIWRFIDDPQDWRRARDLALLSLATYARAAGDEATTEEEDEGDQPQ